MKRGWVLSAACCVLLAAACLPATAQYSIYGSSIYVSGTYAPSWSRVGTSTFSPSRQSDPDSTAADGRVLRAVDTSTSNSGYIRSIASDNGIAFDNADVTAIVRCRTTNESGVTWTTATGVQAVGVCYSVGKGAFLGIMPDKVGFYNTSGSVQAGLVTDPTVTPMDNSVFHTYYVVCRNATSGGVDVELYRDGRLLLSGRPNTTVPSALKVNSAYVDQVFVGSNPSSFTGVWRYDRVAYRTGFYVPYGATDAGGNPVTSRTAWDPWASGTITGTVTDAGTGQPIANAYVELDNGLGILTANDGTYTLAVPTTGVSYNVNASCAGYVRKTVSGVSVPDATPVVQNISLNVATFNVSGVITIAGTTTPIAGATVGLAGGHMATTDANGYYEIYVDPGTYDVTVSAPGFVPKSATPITINATGDPVEMSTSLGPIGTPTRTVVDDFTNLPSETGTPPWILTSPDGYTDTNFGGWPGSLQLYPEDPGHALSLGGDFLPANVDCTVMISLPGGWDGFAGITYRQPSPCTFDNLHGQTGSPGYFVRCNLDGSISLWRNGEALATYQSGITDWLTPHKLNVVAYGSRHWVLLDGMKVIDLVDTAQMSGGYVGLCRAGFAEAWFSSISAAQLPDGGTSGAIATLTGVITDAVTHAPLACAVVKTADGAFWETGADGVYTADLASLDDQSITAYSPGHTNKVVAVTSPHTGSNTLDIAMAPGVAVSGTVKQAILTARDGVVSVMDKLVTDGNDQASAYFFYIQDDEVGGRGMRVRYAATVKEVHEGDRVDIVGTVVHASDNAYITNHCGEREIRPDYVWVRPAHEPTVEPVYIRNCDVGGGFFGPNESVSGGPEPMVKGVYPINKYGNSADGDLGSYSLFAPALAPLNNVGTLARVYGTVTRVCNTEEPSVYDYYIDDGSLPYDGWLQSSLGIGNTNHPAGVRLRIRQAISADLPAFAVGDKLCATGIVGAISSSDLNSSNGTRCIRMIRIRKASDIQKLAQ